MSQKVFLDANVPMYAGGAASPQKADCVAFIRKVAAGGIAGVTSAEVLQEILHRYLHLKRPELARQVYDAFRNVAHEVFAVEVEDLDSARQLMDKYPKAKARDLVHVAVMIRRGITVLASYDADFDEFDEVQRITPPATP